MLFSALFILWRVDPLLGNDLRTLVVIPLNSSLLRRGRSNYSFFFFLVAPTLGSLLPLLEHRAEFPQFLDQGQAVGLLGG
jgi:hypothetical protein